MGYALLEEEELKAWGKFRGKGPWEKRVCQGAEFVAEKIREFSPHEIAVESPFAGANPQSAIKLAHLKGAIMYAACLNSIPIYEYRPRTVKKAITGRGNASKEEVRNFVRRIFSSVETYDEADAVAVAFAHLLLRKNDRKT